MVIKNILLHGDETILIDADENKSFADVIPGAFNYSGLDENELYINSLANTTTTNVDYNELEFFSHFNFNWLASQHVGMTAMSPWTHNNGSAMVGIYTLYGSTDEHGLSGYDGDLISLESNGFVENSRRNQVVPVVQLKSGLMIKDDVGSGKASDPWKIK